MRVGTKFLLALGLAMASLGARLYFFSLVLDSDHQHPFSHPHPYECRVGPRNERAKALAVQAADTWNA